MAKNTFDKNRKNLADHICIEPKIWDLHIHSNQCTSADLTLKQLSIEEYLDNLFPILEKYDLLEMVSFTDHNKISLDLYKAFYKRKTRIKLLPGIEVDTKLDDSKPTKHLVVYFDCMEDVEKLEKLSSQVNKLLESESTPLSIDALLTQLLDFNVPFILSPHAMKQGERSIDSDWHAMSSENRDVNKYVDQFFCFWETSGHSQIAHAIDFLNEMECGDKISVVAFSDSKDFNQLQKYLENPHQYFRALPTFNGVKMAGSEVRRIEREFMGLDPEKRGAYIGSISFDGQSLELSPRLNVIIGGRGSGKSVLLDSLAIALNNSSHDLKAEREEFVKQFSIIVSSLSDSRITARTFEYDYFDQQYITSLFDKSGEDFNNAMRGYFGTAFNQIEDIKTEEIKADNYQSFIEKLSDISTAEKTNVVGLVDNYHINKEDRLNIKILKKTKQAVPNGAEKFNYETFINNFHAKIISAVPEFLREDKDFLESLRKFEISTLKIAHDRKVQILSDLNFQNIIIDCFFAKKSSIDEAQKKKTEIANQFKSNLYNEMAPIEKRASIIKAYINTAENFETHYEETCHIDGETQNAFEFKKELNVQHPLNYLIDCFNSYIKNSQKTGPCTLSTIKEYIDLFLFDESSYKKGKKWEQLYDDLKSFNLEYTNNLSILYKNGEYENIRNMSPGMQTNILLEYIVHRKTTIPLFIDQPEDNVDNQTIYDKIRTWFMTLKETRQIIVVTHDANIVINADAENVIIAEQSSPSHFTYCYGALEYGDIIDKASLILDGGKDAVRRRLIKYGD